MKLLKPHYEVPLEPAIKNMRNPVCLPLLSLLICSLFISCDNEIDLLDDYREIPVIYGIINPSVTSHYVRVQKSFLGPGNALLMAQYADSLYYDTANIRVYIEKIYRDVVLESRLMVPDFSKTKEEGLFTDQGHFTYRVDNFPISNRTNIAGQDTSYGIRFENLNNGIVSRAKTKAVQNISFSTFSSSVKVNLADDDPYAIKFNSSKYGKEYGLVMRIKYNIVDTISLTATQKYIDYKLPNKTSLGLNGGESMSFLLDGESIFRFIGSKVDNPGGSKRISAFSFKADYFFYAGSEDLYNYTLINSPQNTIYFIPEFTNFSYGKGLFTSRYETAVRNVDFNNDTYSALLSSTYTSHIFQ